MILVAQGHPSRKRESGQIESSALPANLPGRDAAICAKGASRPGFGPADLQQRRAGSNGVSPADAPCQCGAFFPVSRRASVRKAIGVRSLECNPIPKGAIQKLMFH